MQAMNVETTNNAATDAADLIGQTVDSYLKKHRLEFTLLPNKKVIKLYDLKSSKTINNNNALEAVVIDSSEDLSADDEQQQQQQQQQLRNKISEKKARKKREPSLKLQQKLTNQDLELIVNSIRSQNAHVRTADVKKENFVDKILSVKLLNGFQLSNGSTEALLKKSMFSKEVSTLFDTFVGALCRQVQLVDEHGICKPILACEVIDCGFRSISEAEMNRHIKRHLAQDGYTCDTCSNKFASMTNLQRHLRVHSELGKEMKCPLCDYKAATVTHIKRHMAHKHLERSLPCPHCNFMGATNAELKIHMARKHLELTGKNPLFLPKYLRRDYFCTACKLQFNDFKEYQTHSYKHTSSHNRYKCAECPYNCKSYSKLKRHMLYHSGSRNYACDLCGNKFYQMEHLKRHLQSIHHQQQQQQNQTSSADEKQLLNESSSSITSSIERIEAAASSDFEFKCTKCEYSTSKIYALNCHVIDKHGSCKIVIDEQQHQQKQQEQQQQHEDLTESIRIESSDEDDENNDESLRTEQIEKSTSEMILFRKSTRFYCAFCDYFSIGRLKLKAHLNDAHLTQLIQQQQKQPKQSQAKFQCGICEMSSNEVDDYIKHMNMKHNIQVYILDSTTSVEHLVNQESQTTQDNLSNQHQQQQQPIQPIQVKRPYRNENQSNSSTNEQLRSFQKCSSKSRVNKNLSKLGSTVRINPRLFRSSATNIQQSALPPPPPPSTTTIESICAEQPPQARVDEQQSVNIMICNSLQSQSRQTVASSVVATNTGQSIQAGVNSSKVSSSYVNDDDDDEFESFDKTLMAEYSLDHDSINLI